MTTYKIKKWEWSAIGTGPDPKTYYMWRNQFKESPYFIMKDGKYTPAKYIAPCRKCDWTDTSYKLFDNLEEAQNWCFEDWKEKTLPFFIAQC